MSIPKYTLVKETTSTPSSTKQGKKVKRRACLYFAIYYNYKPKVPDNAFGRAAETWKREIEARLAFVHAADRVWLKGVATEFDFKNAWGELANIAKRYRVKQGMLLTHASKDGNATPDGLEFHADANTEDNGTLVDEEIGALAALRWDANDALLTLAGCNTGLVGKRGYAPAESFAKRQRVQTVGQSGYAYFSCRKDSYVAIDQNTRNVYLWAYQRMRNGFLGNGQRMAGITFAPAGK